MPGTYRPLPRLPAPLAARIAQADAVARALQRLSAKAVLTDPSSTWLVGRADELRTLVGEIAREWGDGSIGTDAACEAIRSYVGAIHVALHRRYGGSGASCCSPHLEPFPGPSGHPGPARAMRAPLESSVQSLTLADPPASRVRLKSPDATEARLQVVSIPAQRRSVG
jgi:hypothetical protein